MFIIDIVNDVIVFLNDNIDDPIFPEILSRPLVARKDAVSIILLANATGKKDLAGDIADRIAISILSKSTSRSLAIYFNNKVTSLLQNANCCDIGDNTEYKFYYASIYTNLNFAFMENDGSFVFNSNMYLNIERRI